jgi:4-hydroxy-tetrahydrodipicolinate synthase
LGKNTEDAIQGGVAGFLVPAMASEVYRLTETERIRMVETVLVSANGRVPVIAGAGEPDPVKSKKLLNRYIRAGCRNVLFQIPYLNRQQFQDHFMELSECSPEMIMLQDWDSSGYGLPDDLICELFETVEAFRCLKIETVPAGVKYSRILELTGGRLNVSGGWAVSQMIEGLRRGVHAFMPTGMHRIYTHIYRLFTSGKEEEAEKFFHSVLPILAFSNQHLDLSIRFFKRLLFRQGIYPTPDVREPLLPFDRIHLEIADKHIDMIIRLEEELKNEAYRTAD